MVWTILLQWSLALPLATSVPFGLVVTPLHHQWLFFLPTSTLNEGIPSSIFFPRFVCLCWHQTSKLIFLPQQGNRGQWWSSLYTFSSLFVCPEMSLFFFSHNTISPTSQSLSLCSSAALPGPVNLEAEPAKNVTCSPFRFLRMIIELSGTTWKANSHWKLFEYRLLIALWGSYPSIHPSIPLLSHPGTWFSAWLA